MRNYENQVQQSHYQCQHPDIINVFEYVGNHRKTVFLFVCRKLPQL
jgi:hypothetical protein